LLGFVNISGWHSEFSGLQRRKMLLMPKTALKAVLTIQVLEIVMQWHNSRAHRTLFIFAVVSASITTRTR
jgi:hypothetical protein